MVIKKSGKSGSKDSVDNKWERVINFQYIVHSFGHLQRSDKCGRTHVHVKYIWKYNKSLKTCVIIEL